MKGFDPRPTDTWPWEWRREDSWLRAKRLSDEKWPRFCAEVPPELAEHLERLAKKRLGVNVSQYSRAGLVRAALREWLDRHDPEPPRAIEAEAEEVADVPAIPAPR